MIPPFCTFTAPSSEGRIFQCFCFWVSLKELSYCYLQHFLLPVVFLKMPYFDFCCFAPYVGKKTKITGIYSVFGAFSILLIFPTCALLSFWGLLGLGNLSFFYSIFFSRSFFLKMPYFDICCFAPYVGKRPKPLIFTVFLVLSQFC